MNTKRRPLESRFWEKVNKSGPVIVEKLGPCWLWTGALALNNYGKLGAGGKYGGSLLAHRVSWMIHFGPIAEGFGVFHHCDNPPCVNPSHLFTGTSKDNTQDTKNKGRLARGERVHSAKLTATDAQAIRDIYAQGELTMAMIAERFDVSLDTVSSVVLRKHWKHIGEPDPNARGFNSRNRRKTHCPKGHEYNADNARLSTDKFGHTRRQCITCERLRALQAYPATYAKNRERILAQRKREYQRKKGACPKS